MSSYVRAAPPHHNYELFSIVRLVGISNQHAEPEKLQRGGMNKPISRKGRWRKEDKEGERMNIE